MATRQLSLEDADVQLLLRSLDHCLATCTNKSASPGPCQDCDSARKLRQKLADALFT
jgi:hypothetical protein